VSPTILVGKQKTFTFFLGTIHGSHRESKLGLQRLEKWVFAWILKKILIPKGKGYDPILTPGPNVSWYKSTKKILPG